MTTLHSEDDIWLDRVRDGDFAAVPHELSWLQSARLAHLINGYDTSRALGLGDLHAWANARADEAARIDSWRGGAIELWLCLFYEHRRWRHFGCQPEDQECDLLDRLSQQLRQWLGTASKHERGILVWQIAGNPPGAEACSVEFQIASTQAAS